MNIFIKAGLTIGAAALILSPVSYAVEGGAATSEPVSGNWIVSGTTGGITTYGLSAPEGFGENSVRLKTGESHLSQVSYTQLMHGSLSDLSKLSYWTKQVVASKPGGSITAKVALDLDGDSSIDTILMYEPYLQNSGNPDAAPVKTGVWQNWDVLNGGLLWSNSNFGAGESALVAGVEGGLHTLQDILVKYPVAQLRAVVLSVGSSEPNSNIGLDGVYINNSFYDFENSEAEEDVIPADPETPAEPEEPPVLTVPSHKDQCKKDGWKTFKTVDGGNLFKNQGQCVSFVVSNSPNKPSNGLNVPVSKG